MGSWTEMEKTGTAKEHEAGTPEWHAHKRRNKGLVAIGLFKLVEAAFFLMVGLGIIHFLHRDLGDAVLALAAKLNMNSEGRLVGFLIDHLDAITAHRLKQIGAVTFFYSGLRVAEGVGLVLEKVWAEYLTVGVTVSFLPWEMYEIVKRPDWFRVSLLVVNLIVLAYLLWWLRRRKKPGAEHWVAD